MKRLLLAAALCAGSFMSANAAYIKFYNMTNCSFNLNLIGAIGNTAVFGANSVIIPPGPTLYADPTQVPGVSQSGPGSLASGHLQIIKGYDVGGPYSFVVGVSPAYPTMSTTYNSASNSYYPACYNNTAYTVTFSPNMYGDVIVLIF